jgi:hypothetical protein
MTPVFDFGLPQSRPSQNEEPRPLSGPAAESGVTCRITMNYSEIDTSDFPHRSLRTPFDCIGTAIATLSLRRERLSPGGTEASHAHDGEPPFTQRAGQFGF